MSGVKDVNGVDLRVGDIVRVGPKGLDGGRAMAGETGVIVAIKAYGYDIVVEFDEGVRDVGFLHKCYGIVPSGRGRFGDGHEVVLVYTDRCIDIAVSFDDMIEDL